VTTESILSRV